MAVRSYRDLEVWQTAVELVVLIYQTTQHFPSDERFGLTNQVRRSSVSVAANIAEGQGRIHIGDFLRFLSIARGSLMETETHFELAVRLGFVTQDKYVAVMQLAQTTGRLLNGLIRSLDAKRN